MIILHNIHDKDSREFVEKYGENNEILTYPECLEKYPNISAFPSVVIDVPGYHTPAQVIKAVDSEGNQAVDSEGKEVPDFTVDEFNTESYVEIYRFKEDPCDPDAFWKEIQEYIKMINQRAIDNPIK